MKSFRYTSVVVVTALLLLASARPYAGTITISDLTDGAPSLLLSGFPTPATLFCGNTSSEILGCTLTFAGPVGVTAVSVANIFLYEDAGILSDVLLSTHTINNGLEGFAFTFLSNSDTAPLVQAGSMNFIALETGLAQLFNLPSLCTGCSDITISLQSDAPEGTVPEPATLALLGIGLAGVGFSRRRKSH